MTEASTALIYPLDDRRDAQVIAEVAAAAVEPFPIDPSQIYTVVTPLGVERKVIDAEQHLASPRRKTGTVLFYEDRSFSRYLNKHKIVNRTEAYADVDKRRVVALVNGHGGDVPGWGDHRANLELRFTPDWKFWSSLNGTLNAQLVFAEHIEDGIDQIIDPPGAQMLELAQSFNASRSVSFRSAQRLSNGETKFNYTETINASAGSSGEITIPQEFTLALAVFEGTDPYRMTARLRYRLTEGTLSIGYQLVRPEDTIRAAFNDVLDRIEGDTELTMFHAAEPERA